MNSIAFSGGVLPGSLNNIGIGVADGSFTFDDGSFGNTGPVLGAAHSWALSVYARDNINLSWGLTNANDIDIYETGSVILTAATGGIFDTADGAETLDIWTTGGASDLTLSAATGIVGTGGAGPSIEIRVPELLNAQVTGAGAIDLWDVAGGLIVTSATTFNGNITIVADDSDSAGNINLQVDNITAGGGAPGVYKDVTLTASSGAGWARILETGADGAADITANNLNLTSDSNLGTDNGYIGTNADFIEIAATTLTNASVDGTGGIYLYDTAGGLIVTSATTNDGDIKITADGGNLTATTVTAGDSDATITEDVTLTTTTSGNVYVDNVTAPDNIQITSAGTIEEAGAGDAGADLTSTRMSLTANDGIGTVGNAIELDTVGFYLHR